jgi:hypothetical protein
MLVNFTANIKWTNVLEFEMTFQRMLMKNKLHGNLIMITEVKGESKLFPGRKLCSDGYSDEQINRENISPLKLS